MVEEEVTDQELYEAFKNKMKEYENKLEQQKKEIETLKLEVKKNAEETQSRSAELIGVCVACGHSVTRKDVEHADCPYCGQSRSYSTSGTVTGIGATDNR